MSLGVDDLYDELNSLYLEIKKQIEKLTILHGSKKQEKFNFIKSRISYGKTTLRHLKLEIRNLSPEKQSTWKEKTSELELALNNLIEDSEISYNQNRHLQSSDSDSSGELNTNHATHQVVQKALKIQQTDIRIVEELIITTNEINTLGTETLNEIQVQNEKLETVSKGISEIELGLKEAGRELRTLSRRMAKDKICLALVLLAVLLLIAIIVYAVFFDQSGNTAIPDSLKPTLSNSWFQDFFDTTNSN